MEKKHSRKKPNPVSLWKCVHYQSVVGLSPDVLPLDALSLEKCESFGGFFQPGSIQILSAAAAAS